MTRITCDVITDLLELYSDNVVSEDTKILVDDHLKDCTKCSKKLEQIKQNLNIPVEVNAEPIRKLKRKIRKKNILISFISIVVIAGILLGTFLFMTQHEVAMPFEKTHIYNVELSDNDDEILIHFMDNIESYAMLTSVNYDEATMEIYIHFNDTFFRRHFSNHANVSKFLSVPAFESYSTDIFTNFENMNVTTETHDTLPGEFVKVETIKIFYSTFSMKLRLPGATFDDKHLLWERQVG